jgi:nucleoside-diphosphate-sugar epimerase
MRVLVAGASGAIGMPLIRRLHAAGHNILAAHRSPGGRARLADAGAVPIQADVLRRDHLQALAGRQADAVIFELTALKETPTAHKVTAERRADAIVIGAARRFRRLAAVPARLVRHACCPAVVVP